jgi:hypothetical protein
MNDHTLERHQILMFRCLEQKGLRGILSGVGDTKTVLISMRRARAANLRVSGGYGARFLFPGIRERNRQMTTAEAITTEYMRVSSAAVELRVDSGSVYRSVQRGDLKGLCIDGRWLVERASVERLKEARQK